MACGVRQGCCARWYALFWVRVAICFVPIALFCAVVIRFTGWRYALWLCFFDGIVCAAVFILRKSESARGYTRFSDRIVISCGALFPRTTVLFRRHISFAALSASPLERLLGLRTLTLHTTGGAVKMRGLERSEAERLRENLFYIGERKAV